MPRTRIALLRGVNVGTANRISMGELRTLIEGMGYTRVATLLNSGNVVFDAPDKEPCETAAARIEAALFERLGVKSAVVLLTAADLVMTMAENPLHPVANNPSRMQIIFVQRPADLQPLRPLLEQDWSPEAIAVGSHAAYVWCPDGVSASRVMPAAIKALGPTVMTSRAWATILKLAMLVASEDR